VHWRTVTKPQAENRAWAPSAWVLVRRTYQVCGGGLGFFTSSGVARCAELFLGKIQSECSSDAAQLQAFDQFAADIASGVFQSFYSAVCSSSVPSTLTKSGVLHVLLARGLRWRRPYLPGGVFQLSDEHGIDFVSDFFAHAEVTMIRWDSW